MRRRPDFARNTLIIFTSDNGGVLLSEGDGPEATAYRAGLRPNAPWRGRKHSIYQGGFRVAFLARWPGKIPAGSVKERDLIASHPEVAARLAMLLQQQRAAGRSRP